MSTFSTTIRPFGYRLIRLLIAALICTTLLFTSAISAFAATSQPTEGEANLTQIREKAEEIANQDTPPGYESNKVKTTDGLNMAQESADQKKMKTEENSNATSVEDKVERGLGNLFN